MIQSESNTVKKLFSNCDCFYFTQNVLRKLFNSNAGTSRFACEVFFINCVECCEISHISKETCCLYNVVKCKAGFFEDSAYILAGLLCINFYLNTPFSEYISNFVACGLKPQEQYENRKENFSSSSVELLEDMAEEIRREVIEEKDIPTSNRNKEIIQRLYQKGVYNMKDAVGRTAEILGISKNTVYLHLRNLEQE